jgi:DNA replication and repair protein RecF
MTYIESLHLNSFRNYAHADLQQLERGFIVLTGVNGAGKTNALEAVSLLAPGRGLRNATPLEIRLKAEISAGACVNANAPIKLQQSAQPWAVRAHIAQREDDDRYMLATGEDPSGKSRIAKLNGERLSALSHLSEYFSCVWFTPQMSGLFMGGASERRRFFDRLVFIYDPSHAGRLRRYEKALSERSRILKDAQNNGRRPDAVWLDGVEITLAETAVALAASRLELLEKLQQGCRDVAGGIFPPLDVQLSGGAEEALMHKTALAVEDDLKAQFRASRVADSYTGGSAAKGAHRTDMAVTYLPKNMPAEQSSTGEQKAMLLTIILAHAQFIHQKSGVAPVILLDEISAHLDERRRASLFEILGGLQGQVWMSGTEKSLFDGLENARFVAVAENTL